MKRAAWVSAMAASLAGIGGCVPPPATPPAPAQPGAPAVTAPPPLAYVPPPATFALSGIPRQGGVMLGTAPIGTTSLTLDGAPVGIAADRRFLIAFDRDAAPRATLIATLADGRQAREVFDVAPGEWRIERLDSVAKTPVPDAEFARRRPDELAQIRAAREIRSDAQGWRQHFIWPASGRISGLFGAQRVYRGEPGAYHGGVDVAKPTGAPVVAPADGVVILAAPSPFTLEGNLLMVDHGMGLNSAFLHLSKIEVKAGDHVRQGQEIGLVGATGRASGPHLHWAMMWQGKRIDPMRVAGDMGR
ncbi:M23 family metallopeptidase [Sphingomonas sp. TX0543]|uniref:M23 family metallopeptidase n=1 Tax=unclassified Sphingomonas TaxID=196159 RepID=UPI002016632A|nr:M23 family metallopeptidase [Sphingomonas sp. 3P27F8]